MLLLIWLYFSQGWLSPTFHYQGGVGTLRALSEGCLDSLISKAINYVRFYRMNKDGAIIPVESIRGGGGRIQFY